MITGSFFKKTPQDNFYVDHQSNKPVTKGSGVNVLYFTNKCNLACTYCYEDLPGRPPQILTKEEIKKSIDKIIAREDPQQQTLIVLFGGEATLEWDNVCFAMDYAYSLKKNVHFNLNTNGIKYLSQKFLKETTDNFFYKHGLLTIDVSFDGIGNGDRVFHNGKSSTSTMIEILKRLVLTGFRYRIRYTIQKNNIDFWYDDIRHLIKTFRPQRVITSVAWTTLATEDMIKLQAGKTYLRDLWINNKVIVPICSLFCDICSGCGERKEITSYFTDEGNVRIDNHFENAPIFGDFKEKVLT